MDTLEVRTDRREQLVDITSDVELSIAAAGLTEGACVLWSAHTTGGLTVNGLAGDDDIDIDVNDLNLTNGITVNGNDPSTGDGDTVTVRGGSATWTPSSGTLAIAGSETITVNGTEALIYDGEGGGITVTVAGTDATADQQFLSGLLGRT